MGNGNFDVGKRSPAGKSSPTRKPGQPIGILPGNDGISAQRIDTSNLQKAERPKICGSMTQQCTDGRHDNESAPQKFVHLVGCRDVNARPETWVRPRPVPAKQ